jgi:hypothetical protein
MSRQSKMTTVIAVIKKNAFQLDAWHHLSCKLRIANEGIARHNDITNLIEQHVRMAGGMSRKEPGQLTNKNKRRPDLQIFCPDKNWLIDVSVSNPINPTHQDSSIAKSMAAAAKSAKKKARHYKEICQDLQSEFCAFACETLGGLHSSARSVINKVASLTNDYASIYSHTTIRQSLLDSVATAIQRGNANMMIAASINKRSKQAARY